MAHAYDFFLLSLSSSLDENKGAKNCLKARIMSHLKLNSQHLAQSRFTVNVHWMKEGSGKQIGAAILRYLLIFQTELTLLQTSVVVALHTSGWSAVHRGPRGLDKTGRSPSVSPVSFPHLPSLGNSSVSKEAGDDPDDSYSLQNFFFKKEEGG